MDIKCFDRSILIMLVLSVPSGKNINIQKGDNMTKKEAEERRKVIAKKVKEDGIKSISKMERFFLKNFSTIYMSL